MNIRQLFYDNNNRTNCIQHQKVIKSNDDLMMKAYYAGMISAKACATVWGIGSKSGTNWAIGTQVIIDDVLFNEAKTAFLYFTDILNQQKKNSGYSSRKKQFALTQFDEVFPLMSYLGLHEIFADVCLDIASFDKENALSSKVEKHGRIINWEKNTLSKTIQLVDYELEILEHTIKNLLLDCSEIPEGFESTLSNAFIEGQRGWSVGADEFEVLLNSRSLKVA